MEAIPIPRREIPSKFEESLVSVPMVFPVMLGDKENNAPIKPSIPIAIKILSPNLFEETYLLTIGY